MAERINPQGAPKHTDYLTPEQLAEHARIREEVEAELPEYQHRLENLPISPV